MAGWGGAALGALGGIRGGSLGKATPKTGLGGISIGGHGFGANVQFPAPAPAPYQQNMSSWAPAPTYNSGGGNYGGGGGSAPIPAPAPPQETYSMNDANDRIAGVDSTFRDQESQYNEALAKVVANLGKRRDGLERDSKRSREGISKNRNLGLTGLGEDFAARGLGNSGLYVDATEKAKGAYQQQDDSVVSALADGKEELGFTETKERSDTTARIQQAKRDALYRLQMNNNLVTGL